MNLLSARCKSSRHRMVAKELRSGNQTDDFLNNRPECNEG